MVAIHKIDTKYSSLMLLLIAACLLYMLGYSSWPVADDYSNFNTMSRFQDPISAASYWYLEWTGRLFTSALSYSVFTLIGIDHLNIISGIFGFSLILLCYLIVFIADRQADKVYQASSIVLIPILWFVMKPIVGEVVYWVTGGIVYLLPLLLGLYWCVIQKKLLLSDVYEQKLGYVYFVTYSLFSLIVGNCIENLSPALLVYGACLLLNRWRHLSMYSRAASVLMTLNVMVGTIVLISAPGNFNRARCVKNSLDIGFIDMVRNYMRICFNYLWHFRMQVCVILAGLILLTIIRTLTKDTGSTPAPHKRIGAHEKQDIIYSTILMLSGLSTIIPMTVVHEFAAPRTSMYFIIFTLVGVLSLKSHFLPTCAAIQKRLRIIASTSCITISLLFILDVTRDIYLASGVRDQMANRQEIIKNSNNKNMIVSSIVGAKPTSLHFNDINTDPKHWVNSEYARYYKLESIVRY